MDIRYWSIKQHLDHWLELHNLTNIIATEGPRSGSKTVKLYILTKEMTNIEFAKKYPILETEYFKGYLTKDTYPYLLHVSFQRKKYLYT